MVPGDMYKWSGGIFAKKTKFHDAGGPGTAVSPICALFSSEVGKYLCLTRISFVNCSGEITEDIL